MPNIVREKLEKGWIHGRVIVEMLGAPKDYIEKTLKLYVDKMRKDPDLYIIDADFKKPKKQKDMFHAFTELDMMFKDAAQIVFFCFDYMPSSIEIIEPQRFIYKAIDFAAFFNDFLARLHRMDMLVKNMKAENKMLQINASRLLRNNIIISLHEKDKDIKQLSRNVGIPEDQLDNILELMIQDGFIKKKGGSYSAK